MNSLFKVLKKHDLKAFSYEKKGKVIFVKSNKGNYVIKKKDNNDIFGYLDSRSFNYYPNYIDDDEYLIMEYLEEENIPNDEKVLDLINLVSLLHSKTSYYSSVDIDIYKSDYETLKTRINFLLNHYDNLMTTIESKVFMSPSELLLSRNISIIYGALNYSNEMLDVWYNSITDKSRRRYALIHNNLDLNHFIKNRSSYLISWDNAKRDLPIYDIYNLYKKYAFSFDFKSLLKKYEKNYPLLKDEKMLLFILISIPDEFDFTQDTYNDCVRIEKLCDYLYKTESLISPEKSIDREENNKTN